MSDRVFCSLAGNLLEWSRGIILIYSILDIFQAYFNILVTILNGTFATNGPLTGAQKMFSFTKMNSSCVRRASLMLPYALSDLQRFN